jgi:hypothetical protein
VAVNTIISGQATELGDIGKSEETDRLWQIEGYILMKRKEARRTF